MDNIIAVWKKLWQDNGFLKLLSVLLAFIIWLVVIAVASPVNNKTFYKIPVSVSFEGSVPDRNGLMMIMADTDMSINVEVSGTRSALVTLRDSDIRASLNFDAVTAPGIYSVPISVSIDSEGVAVEDISPNDHVIIQFAEIASKKLSIELEYTGEYPSGYVELYHEILPKTVTVSGPADTVDSIERAVVRIDPSAHTEDYTETCAIHLLDASGDNVDRKYLTLSAEEAVVPVSITYTSTVPLSATLKNTYGGNEAYASVTFFPETVTLRGSDSVLKKLSSVLLGEIKLENYKDGDTVSFTLPQMTGISYVGASAGDTVTATVHLPDTQKASFIFTSFELTGKNLLPGYAFTESYIVNLRLQSAAADALSRDDITLTAVLTSEGKARISVSLPVGISYGVMEEYDVPVTKR